MRFEFHPSLRRLEFCWNTAAVWKAMSQEQTPPAPERAEAPAPWVLWRQNLQNYFRSMTAAESAALDAALRDLSFGEICEDLAAVLPEDEIPAAAAGLLGTWADSGIIITTGARRLLKNSCRPRRPVPCATRESAAHRTTRICREIHASATCRPRQRPLLASQSARNLRIMSLPSV